MTEQEWLTCADPEGMIGFLRNGVACLVDQSPPEQREVARQHLLRITARRKLGLFACACCRRLWPILADERSRRAVEIAERYLDGEVGDAEVDEAARAAIAARYGSRIRPGAFATITDAMRAKWTAVGVAAGVASLEPDNVALESATVASWAGITPTRDAALAEQTDWLRDIVGKPFRPVSVDPSWLTSDVVQLARGIYEERVFDRMPILADALQDAGCDNEDVLNHCRNDTVHVHGCWVVDLVLGKT